MLLVQRRAHHPAKALKRHPDSDNQPCMYSSLRPNTLLFYSMHIVSAAGVTSGKHSCNLRKERISRRWTKYAYATYL